MRLNITLSLILLLILVGQSTANAKMAISPEATAMNQIAYSKDLTVDQKTERLLPYLNNVQWRVTAVLYLTQVNPKVGFDRGIGLFRDINIPRPVRIRIGKLLVTGQNPTRPEFPKAFIPEYATYLKECAISGDEQKFMTKSDGSEPNAIEELAHRAANFEGYQDLDYSPFADPRLIPIFIRCLDAPDNVYPEFQGDLILGKAGESTGRNIGRQNIPLALAKLRATEAVPALRKIVRNHKDHYLRDNAAYALAFLEDPSEHAGLIALMRRGRKAEDHSAPRISEKDRYVHLFAFGRGLIARGDDAGLEYMAFEYSIYNDRPDRNSFRYMISQRLEVLKDFHSPKMDQLIAQYWADPRVMNFWLVKDPPLTAQEKSWMTPSPATGPTSRPADTQRQEFFDTFCTIIEHNLAQSIPSLQIIARDSADPVIRQRARRCIDTLTISN